MLEDADMDVKYVDVAGVAIREVMYESNQKTNNVGWELIAFEEKSVGKLETTKKYIWFCLGVECFKRVIKKKKTPKISNSTGGTPHGSPMKKRKVIWSLHEVQLKEVVGSKEGQEVQFGLEILTYLFQRLQLRKKGWFIRTQSIMICLKKLHQVLHLLILMDLRFQFIKRLLKMRISMTISTSLS